MPPVETSKYDAGYVIWFKKSDVLNNNDDAKHTPITHNNQLLDHVWQLYHFLIVIIGSSGGNSRNNFNNTIIVMKEIL